MKSSDEAPPHKRLASEQFKCDSTSHVGAREHAHSSPALSARMRFMKELERYASDDDDDSGVDKDSTVAGARPTWQRGPDNGALQRSSTPPPASDMRVAASSVRPSSISHFFFGGEGDEHDEGDDDGISNDPVRGMTSAVSTACTLTGVHATSSNNANRTNGSRATPSRVGLQLLHRMHDTVNTSIDRNKNSHRDPAVSSAPTSVVTQGLFAPLGRTSNAAASKDGPCMPFAQKTRGNFEVVHSYAPLSTGGFLSTASAADDTMEGQQVRIGDVLSLRKHLGSAASSLSNGAAGAPALSGATSTAPSPTSPTSAAPGDASVTGSLVETVAQKAMGHFKRADTFTPEEQKYGRQLTPDMVRLLFEVARVDQQSRSIEALFLDGTRAKVSFFEVRPAGYVERRMYAKWKADPASRPVATILSNASSPTTSSAQSGAVLPSSASAPVFPPTSPVTAAAWWVIPRLLVRLTTEAAGDWYGKKCVVKAVQRSENRVRLTEWIEEGSSKGDHSSGKPMSTAPETRELIGVDGLETVVPKKGGRAMVVLGSQRGEMCIIRNRIRGPHGELAAVEVEISRTKEVMTLQAEELCALAR
ncbi:hypothetical protein JKF63_05558 [Porcisia hertigi]|uniref:Uncharacterized protein n=1 Tax=Porcisia hertigi TaxID=2761500 RepID=A0A836L9C5_9TRYP|nr:hypothetical protein JKF63_05558 [Porcisia hertigi]